MFYDLGIALGIVLMFLYNDAKRRKRPANYVVLCGVGMLFLGSISPLIYLLVDKKSLRYFFRFQRRRSKIRFVMIREFEALFLGIR